MFRAAVEGLRTLEEDRAGFHLKGLLAGLDKAAAQHLETLMMTDEKLRDIRLPYARAFVAQGRTEGKAEGEADALLNVLGERNFEVSEEIRQKIMACTDVDQLRTWVRRAVTADKIEKIFD